MGMAKIDHIRELFKMDGVGEEFEKLYHRPSERTGRNRYERQIRGIPFCFPANYTDPIPGVIDTLNELRKQGIKIGSTTGYTQAMMDVVLPNAARKGYTTDKCVTPNGLPAGRPLPLYDLPKHDRSCHPFNRLCSEVRRYHRRHQGGYQCQSMDRRRILGSNELGLTQEEVEQMSPATLTARKAEVRQRMLLAGAHYVVDSIEELPKIIELINHKLNTNH